MRALFLALALLPSLAWAQPAFPPPASLLSSGAAAAALAGPGLAVYGSTQLTQTAGLSKITASTYTLQATDAAKTLLFSNASGIAVSLPSAAATGFTAGFSFGFQVTGAGSAVLTPASGTINGAASLTAAQNTGCEVTSDGANWQIGPSCTAVAPSSGGGSLTTAIPSAATTAPECGSGAAGAVAACSSTLVLPNGASATTQTTGANPDTSADVATDAFVAKVAHYPSAIPFPTGSFKPLNTTAAVAASAPTSGRLTLSLIEIPPGSATVKTLSVYVSGAPSAAYVVEGCVYSVTSGAGAVGSLVTGGDTTATSTGTSASTVIATTFPSPLSLSGWYWFGVLIGGTVTGTMEGASALQPAPYTSATQALLAQTPIVSSVTVGAAGTSNCPASISTTSGNASNVAAAVGF